MRKFISTLMALALLAAPGLAQTGCVIPGATTVPETTNWSPLAADTGKIYWANCASACTVTVPTTPPTAVWRIQVDVVGAGTVTIAAGGTTINYPTGVSSFSTGWTFQISTDGSAYYAAVLTGITSAQMAVANTYRVCDIAIGDTSASALTNAQLGPQSRVCFVPAASTIVEMDVNADAGTPNIIIGRNHAGTIVNIVSAALATAASGGIACSNTGGTTGINGATTCSATLQNTSLSAGDYLEAVSGTAGGTAKFFVAHIIYTVN